MAALAVARNAAVGSRHCGCRLAAGSRISSAAWVTLVALLVGGVCCQTSRAVSGQRAIAEAAQRPPTTDVSSSLLERQPKRTLNPRPPFSHHPAPPEMHLACAPPPPLVLPFPLSAPYVSRFFLTSLSAR